MERDFDIEIGNKGKIYKSLCYDFGTGKIFLFNNWKFLVKKWSFLKDFLDTNLNHLPSDLSHEIMHKWLHENISDDACEKWDNIDKITGETKYRFSTPDSLNFFKRFS
jgi:hypothetical protein